jgi:putative tricarboxylic transport membrane protein
LHDPTSLGCSANSCGLEDRHLDALANLLLIPLGWVAIRSATQILRVPRGVLIPLITMFCVVGAFAVTNSTFSVIVMAIFGVLAYLMEENGFPVAPTILGIVLGGTLEQSFMTAMMKTDGNLLAFFQRPIAATLGVITLLIWLSPPALGLWRKRLLGADAQASSRSSRT